jgi:hypothetical protein
MGLPQKGTRRIVVGGFPYRWLAKYEQVGWLEGYCCPVSLFVEREDTRGQLLVTHFACYGKEVITAQTEAVTPGLVRQIMETALARGWQPARQGLPPFAMDGKEFFPDPEEPLFSAKGLAVLDRQPYDSRARGSYNIFVHGLQWPDEFPAKGSVALQQVSDHRAARLLIYRASLTLGEELPEVRPLWEQVVRHAPNWPGLREERWGERARRRLRAGRRREAACREKFLKTLAAGGTSQGAE